MRISNLRDLPNEKHLRFDDTGREIYTIKVEDAVFDGRSVHYPNCLLKTKDGQLINPYDERVMSLQKDSFYDDNEWESTNNHESKEIYEEDAFFFVYNVDNYYHFIYDTLPILYSYFQLKEKNPHLKLLLQTSYPTKKTFSPFVTEFLSSLGINDFLLANKDTIYKTIYISTSFTHGGKSNDLPAKSSFSVWKQLALSCLNISQELPKRFYISRRSWVHGKTENMGTNYTQRRKCENEDALVALLQRYDIQEIFTELLTTEEKLALFAKAEVVVGIVGGGMCNLLFSPSTTKSLCISTPSFLDINKRFQYSMDHTNIVYSDCSKHISTEKEFLLFSRVRVVNPESPSYGKVGEVEGYTDTQYTVRLSSNDVAGFSQDFPMECLSFRGRDLIAVDKGLNSPFECNLVSLEEDLKNLLQRT
jgi:hypothetical protein